MKAKRLLLFLFVVLTAFSVFAQQRRPIDSRHPLWLIHVDVWNQADPQKIINLIPEDIRPFVCINLSLSCQYDKTKDVYKMPQNAVATFKSWATVCQQNKCWFTCQPASGGHTHIQDSDLDTFEYFFKNYPNFLGWNYAEQFWGFDEKGDKSSSTQTSRIALFAKLVKMSHQYGGFLTVSFCGNIWSHALNPVGMMKRNSDLYSACRQYPEAILWLYKYTTSSCWYNNESVTISPFISGLASNYGVRYDNCGWNGTMEALFGKDDKRPYPNAAGIGTVMEQTGVNGGAVWDGPELIWTEDFKNLANTNVDGYTRRNWGTYPGFRNVWVDLFRKVIDGTLYIPTREEVVKKTKVAIVNDVKSGNDEDKYASWGDLYDGLYKQDDPFNKENGQWMNNFCYFKKTGRYNAIPVAISLEDELAKNIPLQVKKSEHTSKWPSIAGKVNDFDRLYPEVSSGDLYINRFRNQLVTYNPYTYLNKKQTATANIPLKYNTCNSLSLTYSCLSSGIVREYKDRIDVYLNNFRKDTVAAKVDRITIMGATAQPTYKFTKREEAVASVTETWQDGKYILDVTHNGPVDIEISCVGAAKDRSTDYLPSSALTADLPAQPSAYTGEVYIEAEDMDYRNISNCTTSPYNTHPDIRGHAGNGFIVMGTSKMGSLRHNFKAPKAGKYAVSVRYMNTSKQGNLKLTVGNSSKNVGCPKTEMNEWKNVQLVFDFAEGENTLKIENASGMNLLIDQICYRPATKDDKDDSTVEEETPAVDPADKPLPYTVWKDNFAEKGANYIPDGWVICNGGNYSMSGAAYSGPRVFLFGEGGDIDYGFYARTMGGNDGFNVYGTQEGYRLSLNEGSKYNLSFNAAAWKGTPWLKVEVLDANNNLVASQIKACEPNIDGALDAIHGTTKFSLTFTVNATGNYLIRFTPVANEKGETGAWLETIFGIVLLTSDTPVAGIAEIESTDGKDATKCFNLNGMLVKGSFKGIVIQGNKKLIRK